MRIAHAVCERSRDARARVHHSNLILALVVPRRERLIPRGETKRVKQCAYNGEDEEKTHNHSVECDEDATLGPVRLSICRHIVHEKTRADEERDFEQVCAFHFSRESRVGCSDTYRRVASKACWSTNRGV